MSSDIFVLVEHLEGKIGDVTYELLGKGRELSAASGGSLVAVLLGSGVKGLADTLGAADKVLVVDDPALQGYTPEGYKRALGALAKERGPRVLLIANTAVGMDQ